MPYLVDRGRALRLEEIVAIVKGSQRPLRTRVVLRDNSWHQTLTRPRTLIRYSREFTTTGGWARAWRRRS